MKRLLIATITVLSVLGCQKDLPDPEINKSSRQMLLVEKQIQYPDPPPGGNGDANWADRGVVPSDGEGGGYSSYYETATVSHTDNLDPSTTYAFVQDVGLLSCKSFLFNKLSSAANSQEAGVRGLRFVIDVPSGTGPRPARIFNFRTMYISIGVTQANGNIITPGKAASIAARAANRAGASMVTKYANPYFANYALTMSPTEVEREFKTFMELFLSDELGGYASISFTPTGKRTVITNAVWNGPLNTMYNWMFDVGCDE